MFFGNVVVLVVIVVALVILCSYDTLMYLCHEIMVLPVCIVILFLVFLLFFLLFIHVFLLVSTSSSSSCCCCCCCCCCGGGGGGGGGCGCGSTQRNHNSAGCFFPGSEDGASIAPSGMGTEDHWDAWSLSKTSAKFYYKMGYVCYPPVN